MHKGFFHKEQINPSCGGICKLNKGCYSPKMPISGDGEKKILIIGEAPEELDDKENTQFIGLAGQLFRETLADCEINLDQDCRKTNAVRCRPPEDRKPTIQEIGACRQYIQTEIERFRPALTFLLGQVAVESFLLGRVVSPGAIGRWRGMTIPDQKAKSWICPIFHPAYILRSQKGRAIRGKKQPLTPMEELIFQADIKHGLSYLKIPFEEAPTPQMIQEWDWRIESGDTIAIDYETTGLRPWRKGHRIVSVGISNGEWMWAGAMTNEVAKKWKKILVDPSIKKIAHNMKFEHQWASHCLGVETASWLWDTMLGAHMIDNRKRYCKLKHQVYINFGVPDWSGDINFGNDNDDFAVKDNIVTKELLQYNALDAFWTFQLAEKQIGKFET